MHVRLQISIVLKIHHFPFNESIKLSRVLSYKQFGHNNGHNAYYQLRFELSLPSEDRFKLFCI